MRPPAAYPVKLTVFCDDRFGMLKQHHQRHRRRPNQHPQHRSRASENSQASVDIVLDIADLKHLENIMAGLRKIPGVHEVQRLQKI